MSGYGNKAWRRAGCAVPDTRTQQRVEVVGLLQHAEWRKETPLKKKVEMRCVSSAYRYFRRDTSNVVRRYARNTAELWDCTTSWRPTAILLSWCTAAAGYIEITEQEARLMIPEAFVNVPIYYRISGYPYHLCRCVDGVSASTHVLRGATWDDIEWEFNRYDPNASRFTVITEQEAREFMPSAFED